MVIRDTKPGKSISEHKKHELEQVHNILYSASTGCNKAIAEKLIKSGIKTISEDLLKELIELLLGITPSDFAEGYVEKLLTTIASRSYLHGNNFLKIVLCQIGDTKLRLHYWNGSGSSEENVHCHAWPLHSQILCGTLNSEIYEEDSSLGSQSYPCSIYRKDLKSGKEALDIGEIYLRKVSGVSQTKGDFYSMYPGQMHKVVGTNGSPAATLMFQSKSTKKFNCLVRTKDIKPELNPKPLSIEELKEALAEIYKLIYIQEAKGELLHDS